MKAPFAAALFAVAAAASSGCAPLDMSVFVEGARFLDNTCAVSGDTNLAAGSLDIGPPLAFGVLPSYFAHFQIRSELEPITTESGGDVLAGEARNEFVATDVLITYSLSTGAGVPQATDPIYFVVPPGATDSSIQFNLLDPAASQVIANAVGAGTAASLLVTFRFQGNVRSSSTGTLIPMHTPEVRFPITVTNRPTTLPTCTSPAVPVINGPCGNSQESYSLGCSS
ncbi:MAG TPA: hypothetical protein VND93_31960 [Myxococcales bacterium]|jgi:hypothetical protein|nr:hypothetical protein [Myxococcales bacterium]